MKRIEKFLIAFSGMITTMLFKTAMGFADMPNITDPAKIPPGYSIPPSTIRNAMNVSFVVLCIILPVLIIRTIILFVRINRIKKQQKTDENNELQNLNKHFKATLIMALIITIVCIAIAVINSSIREW